MKLTRIILIAALVALGANEVLQNLTDVKAGTLEYQDVTVKGDSDDSDSDDDDDYGYLRPAKDQVWYASQCRGAKLMFASTQNPPEAVRFLNPLTSPWDGDMRHELAAWGYKEDTSDPDTECEIGAIKPMLDALGTTTENSLHGGPNHCFSVTHANSDIVERDENGNLPPTIDQYYTANGRRYRVTEAYATIIINQQAGIIFFLRRGSAAHEAHSLWRLASGVPVPPDELPALRASSGLAWGFWNRVSGNNLSGIHGFVSMLITNDETRRIIDRVLDEEELDEVPVWPGIEFNVNSGQYLALLGSPNGRAVGYFLAQHKAQIGGNRYVKTIRIFRGYKESTLPSIHFVVDWAPSPPPEAPTDPVEVWLPRPDLGMGDLTDATRNKVDKRINDGRNIIREHVLLTAL